MANHADAISNTEKKGKFLLTEKETNESADVIGREPGILARRQYNPWAPYSKKKLRRNKIVSNNLY